MSVLRGVPEDKHPPRAPMDSQWEVGVLQSSAGSLVVLEFRTPAGEQTYFMPAEFADKLAVALSQNAGKARTSSLVIPTVEVPPELRNGNRHQRRHPNG